MDANPSGLARRPESHCTGGLQTGRKGDDEELATRRLA